MNKGLSTVGRDGPRSIPINGAGAGLWLSLGAPMAAWAGALGRGRRDSMQGKTITDRAGATLWGGWVVWWMGQTPTAPSSRKWQGSQSSQGMSELGFPGPALGKMQSEAARRAGEPSGHGEKAPPEGPGGHHPLVQTDARGPAGQVMGQHLDGQPGAVKGGGILATTRRTNGMRPVLEVVGWHSAKISAWRRWPCLQFQGIP